MTFRSILLATDGSATARPAVERAVELASLLGARLTALYVLDETTYALLPPQADWSRIHEAMRADAERALGEAQEAAAARGVDAERVVREGHPAHVIAQEAARHDLVVMGTLGRSGLAHLLLGSVAEQVIRHAPCPVMVVRAKPADAPAR